MLALAASRQELEVVIWSELLLVGVCLTNFPSTVVTYYNKVLPRTVAVLLLTLIRCIARTLPCLPAALTLLVVSLLALFNCFPS